MWTVFVTDEQFSPWNSIFPSRTHTRLHINHSHLSFFCIRAVFVYFPWYFTLLEYFSLCCFWLEFRLCYPWICVFACRLDCFFYCCCLSVGDVYQKLFWDFVSCTLDYYQWLYPSSQCLLALFLLHANMLNHAHSTVQIILFTSFSFRLFTELHVDCFCGRDLWTSNHFVCMPSSLTISSGAKTLFLSSFFWFLSRQSAANDCCWFCSQSSRMIRTVTFSWARWFRA